MKRYIYFVAFTWDGGVGQGFGWNEVVAAAEITTAEDLKAITQQLEATGLSKVTLTSFPHLMRIEDGGPN